MCYISVVKCEIVRMGGGKLSGTFTSVVISLGIAACLSICTFAAWVNSYSPAFFKKQNVCIIGGVQ